MRSKTSDTSDHSQKVRCESSKRSSTVDSASLGTAAMAVEAHMASASDTRAWTRRIMPFARVCTREVEDVGAASVRLNCRKSNERLAADEYDICCSECCVLKMEEGSYWT